MWYYEQQGPEGPQKVGPVGDVQFMQMAFENKIEPTTLVMHASKTDGEWVPAETVPVYSQRRQQALDDERRRAEQEERERQQAAEAGDPAPGQSVPVTHPAGAAPQGETPVTSTTPPPDPPVWMEPKKSMLSGWSAGCRCAFLGLLLLGGLAAAACGGCLLWEGPGEPDPALEEIDADDLDDLDIDLGSPS